MPKKDRKQLWRLRWEVELVIYDIAVIGGGAAGLAAAVRAKLSDNSLNIVILEALDRVGKKLITTGNGQCNITNSNINSSFYHSETPELINKVFDNYGLATTTEFFSKIGVEIIFTPDGRAYPASYQAAGVVDALRYSADELGIETKCDCKVLDFINESGFNVVCENQSIKAKNIIFATGLLSGGPKLGSFGEGLRIFKSKGYKTSKTTPAIVQVKTETDITKQLKGVKIDGTAALFLNGKKQKEQSGEILFTDYGLSGPPILGISREIERKNGEFTVRLDCAEGHSPHSLENLLFVRRDNLGARSAENFLTGFLNKRLGQVILKQCGVKLNSHVCDITNKQIKDISSLIKNLTFSVKGTTGFNNSQVTAGGISLNEININTMESRRQKGLYIIGELLDVDGDCGGYNLQWAWSTAFAAAESIAKKHLEKR